EVREVSLEEEAVELLTEEGYDLMLLVGPETDKVSPDLITAVRDIRPSTHIYLLASDGLLAQWIPKLQPAMGEKVSLNDLPILLRDEISHADLEREHFRVEWLNYSEEIVEMIATAETIRDAARQVVERLQDVLRCVGVGVVLNLQPGRPPTAVAVAGDDDTIKKISEEPNAIYEYMIENQAPIMIRRGRAMIPGIQREVVKYGLGPSIFIPIMTSEGMAGALICLREPDADPLADSAFALARLGARSLSLTLKSPDDLQSDNLREMVEQERLRRQSLEDAVTEWREVFLRMAREISGVIDIKRGYRPDRGETMAKLAVAVAEQMDIDTTNLQEAVYLRDIGSLYEAESAPVGANGSQAIQHAHQGFEVLSRIRMPSVCLEVVRHLHENYDGTGLPDGMTGDEIPISARIVRVVEDYINLTNSGNGGSPAPSPVALGNLLNQAGKLYDPDVVEVFSKLIRAQGVTPEQETLSLIAHELRTPLTFLSGFSELLAARNDLPEQAKEMASELHDQTEQMVELTERLLELTRLQSGRLSLTWHWVDLRDLIDAQVSQFDNISERHTVRFEAPSYTVRVRADTTRVTQAVANLINNAIKYSPAGGEIVVQLEEDMDEVVITVSDHGLGIPKEVQGRLFQPFYRVQQAETRGIEGLGLGLALTKAIVDAHGGRIWVESEVGEGSAFYIAMPKQETANERSLTAGTATE
ncbi:MAG: ATP-binding protein, partial [SAR202 cluster bacterium]|nr:ATP-binding protein [SAR202 cluster bacterium]